MKITSMFLVQSEILLLFVAIVHGLSGTKIILDVTQLIKDAIQQGPEQDKAQAALDTVIKKNELTSMLYYEADFYQNMTTEINDVLALFRNKSSPGFGSRIVFSIKDFHGLMGLNSLFYNDLMDLLLNHATIVAGISYHAYYLDSACGYHNETFESHHPTTAIISNMRKYILEFNEKENVNLSPNLGYELHVTYLKCPDHQRNIQLANYLIVNVPFSRTDDGFVESYGLFKNILDNEIMPAVLKSYGKTNLFTKVSLTKTVSRDPWLAFYKIGHLSEERIYYPRQLELLNFAKDRLETFDSSIFPKYEHLLTQYMHQWVFDNKHNNNSIILPYNPDFSHSDSSRLVNNDTKNNNFMPLVSFPFILEEYHFAVEIYLSDVTANGFTSLMFSAEAWESVQKTVSSRRSDLTTINSSKSIKIFYYLENEEQFDKIKNNLANIHGSGDINVGTIVFASEIQFYNKRNWEDELWKSLGSKQIVTLACQISTDNLDTLGYNDICDNPICCEAIKIRSSTIYNCKYHNSKSTTVIWSKTLNLTELDGNGYQTQDLIKTTKKILDIFLIAREIFKKYENNEIIIHIRSIYKEDLSWNGGTTMYCNAYAETISQLYDVILTWAEIHKFPIFLESSGEKYRYHHPLEWNQLEVSTTNPLHYLMNKIPLYIRRKYTTSKTFGWWNDVMYPCIQKATAKNTKDIQSNAFYNAGVTLRMDLRKGNLSITAHEFQILLLLSLYKFSEIEIQITKAHHLTILKESIRISDFWENVKSNQIFGKTIHLEIFDIVCSKINNNDFNEIISELRFVGLKVKISAENFECVHNLKSEVTQVDEIGLVVGNCSREAENIVQTPSLHNNKTKWSQVFYIVCATDKVLAQNRVAKEMQDYLDSHLYLKKLFQYFYPNLKEIHFQLNSLLIKKVNTVSDLLMFLTDVNNYAIGYGMNYFLLPAFATEYNNRSESSFWSITNYSNLIDVNVYSDQLATYLKQTTWVPNILTENGQTKEIIESTIFSTSETSVETSTNSAVNSAITESTLMHQIAGGIGVTAFSIVMIVGVYLFWRNTTRLTQKEIYQFRNGHQEIIRKAVKERQNNRYTVNIYDGLVFQKDFEIPKKCICINRRIIFGKGKFTSVHPATLAISDGCVVCVKIANRKCSKPAFKVMMSELKLLSYLGDHMNLVRFIGCYTREIGKGILWIVTEFCDGGSLHAYLKTKTDQDISELIRFSYGIAKGMEYISNQKVIHGSLRTAVIFLDGTKTCKISGYGRLARKMEDQAKQMKKNKAPKQWQWMAYESLKAGDFSMESDIWSFGVTIWEIFSLGDVPYASITWDDIAKSIESGIRLEKPELASKEIQDLMMTCWSLNPKDRPDFSTLVESFGNLLRKLKN